MHAIYKRVCDWNAARYEQKFDLPLSVSLLREEHQEWLEAESSVDKLDALCDIVYVAMGVMWKIGADEEQISQANENANRVVDIMLNAHELQPAMLIATHIAVFEYDMEYPVLDSMAMIITAAIIQAIGMGLTFDQVRAALNVVCDSNDTKPAVKTASNVKANIDKGSSFVRPEPELQKILDKKVDLSGTYN